MGKLGSLPDGRAPSRCTSRRRKREPRVERSRALTRAAAGLLPLTLLAGAAGCGTGKTDGTIGDAAESSVETTAPTETTLPSCAASRHLAVFDFFGFLSASDQDLRQWLDDPTDAPDVRPGVVDTVNAYRSLGYEIAYLTTVPVNMTIGDVPIDDAIRTWLSQHGFPGGDGTTILTWESGDPIIGITNQLLRFAGQDVSVDIGYTDNQDKAYAIITGGVPADHMYTLGSGAGTEGSRAIPDDDVIAHSHNVERLPKVCEPEGEPGG
jgi:hypothetical protein